MIKAAVVGASGYLGSTLLKLLLKHTQVKVELATSNSLAGKKVSEGFKDMGTALRFSRLDIEELNKKDIVFLAVPHGSAKEIAEKLKCKVVDLSSDHRLAETYGLPESNEDKIKTSRIVANPGCYATACILSVYPIKELIKYAVFDCINGYSGGVKNPKYDYQENIIAYSITGHNHIPEMSKMFGFGFSFTPHVVNTFSGLMCTSHVFLKEKVDAAALRKKYKEFYKSSFTKVVEHIPCTKKVSKTPYCHIGGFEFDSSGQLVIISVIDNLYKGGASQAVENMNIMFGFGRKEGLE